MNTNLCSFALCQLVPFFPFLSKCSLLRNFSLSTTLHALALKFQGTWMVPSNDPFLWKQTSEKFIKQNSNISYILETSFWMSLPINAKKTLLQHLFFATHTFGAPFGAQRSNYLSSFSIFVAFLEMCPLQGLKMFPSPACRLTGHHFSAVSSTCKEITWDKCYGSVRLALFTAGLNKKCSLKLCTRQMAMSSQWDKRHRINMN